MLKDSSDKVAVLHGEVPENAGADEQDVLVQVDAVSGALSELGYEPVSLSLGLDLEKAAAELRALSPLLVFNLVETIAGQARLIQAAPMLLDHLGLPYTGSSTEAVFLTSNKVLAKSLMRYAGIPTPRWFTRESLKNGAPAAAGLHIVKSVWDHASVGLDDRSVVYGGDRGRLGQELESRAERLGGGWFAEEYIDGREFNISMLADEDGPRVLPAAEIVFENFPADKPRVVDYRAKWETDSFEYKNTVRSFDFPAEDQELVQCINVTAESCWRVFGLQGYARVDFRVDGGGRPWVLEVNTNPCLSPDAGFFAAARRAGLTLREVIARIINHLVV